ncbi:MAG: PqqD family protein [Rivularia sp. (in: cyanobacteria)]
MNQTTSILNQKLTIPENTLFQELNGEIVILNIESESYYSLNPMGSKVWQLITDSETVKTAIEQLLQIYLVDEPNLHRDVTLLAQELVGEELLIGCDSVAEEIKKSNQPEQQNQSEPENTQEVDNRIPYEKPLLRKHGKINHETNIINFDGLSFDGLIGYSDIS